jgi:hypothetical protein
METCSLGVAQGTTTNEKMTRLFFSSSRVVSALRLAAYYARQREGHGHRLG